MSAALSVFKLSVQSVRQP